MNKANEGPIRIAVLTNLVRKDTLKLSRSMLESVEYLKGFNIIPFDKLSLNTPESIEGLLRLLNKQSNIITKLTSNRMSWIEGLAHNGLSKTKADIADIRARIIEIQNNYSSKARLIGTNEDQKQLKLFYNLMNENRNLIKN